MRENIQAWLKQINNIQYLINKISECSRIWAKISFIVPKILKRENVAKEKKTSNNKKGKMVWGEEVATSILAYQTRCFCFRFPGDNSSRVCAAKVDTLKPRRSPDEESLHQEFTFSINAAVKFANISKPTQKKFLAYWKFNRSTI